MTRRRLILGGLVAAALVAAAAGLGVALRGESPITKANVDRVRPGMTWAEVETILGTSGRQSDGPDVRAIAALSAINPADVATAVQWVEGTTSAAVLFDTDGRALAAVYVDGASL